MFVILLSVIFIFCGCTATEVTNNQSEPVVINEPTGEDVNGYRNDDYVNSINVSWDDVKPSTNVKIPKDFCGSKTSKKFHKIDCTSVEKMNDENKIYYETKEEYLKNGYSACQICNP